MIFHPKMMSNTEPKSWFQRLILYFTKVRWFSVIFAGLASLTATSLWYIICPLLLLPSWDPSDLTQIPFIKNNAIVGILINASICLIISYVFHVMVDDKNIRGVKKGFIFSLWIGVGLIVSMLGGYIFLDVRIQTIVIDLVGAFLRVLICCLWGAAAWEKILPWLK